MQLRLTPKGNIAAGTLRMTSEEIELQVITDLSKYRKLFSERYQKQASTPLDVESFVKEVWGVEVEYQDIPQPDGEEVLGYFQPQKKVIVVDPVTCNNPRRLSFTIAHEAGHLSLHSFMFASGKVPKNKKPDVLMERQADAYASALLAPKKEVVDFLEREGILKNGAVMSPVDMNEFLPVFQLQFGLSRQATEICFRKLGVPMKNTRY